MHIRDILAQNLKRLCDAEGNVARICREIPVNRQQFNKYLSADSMPHPRSLEKICRYFRVSETELFARSQTETSIQDLGTQGLLDIAGSQQILENLSSGPIPEINPGIYAAYIVVNKSPIEIAWSTIVVRMQNNIATFRRLTNYSEPETSKWHYVRGDHLGIVIERASWLYFIGIADKGLSEPSILAVQWLPLSPKLLSGTALVGSLTGPVALPLIIAPLPASMSLRVSLKLSKTLPLTANEISPEIKNAITRRLSIECHPEVHL